MNKTNISLGFSPCPNDTFIFDAMVHQKIDTQGLLFDYVLADVEELNRQAFAGKIEMTKISFNAFFSLAEDYVLLNSGAALGENNGPLLISKKPFTIDEIPSLKIAIPGKNTTANLLFTIAFPKATNKVEMLFSDIENAVLTGQVDAGLIIHENRFTYASRGLNKIIDLGEYWETLTWMPVPLGGIIVRRDLGEDLIRKIDIVLKNSVEYAFSNPQSAYNFIRQNAQEMEEEVMYKHIGLYVNDFTLQLGEKGKQAIRLLYEKALEIGVIKTVTKDLFIKPK
jgi:1,4-dihydroxy-6-naphthoate synthase